MGTVNEGANSACSLPVVNCTSYQELANVHFWAQTIVFLKRQLYVS